MHSMCLWLTCTSLTSAAVHPPCERVLRLGDVSLLRLCAGTMSLVMSGAQHGLDRLHSSAMPTACLLAAKYTSVAMLEIYIIHRNDSWSMGPALFLWAISLPFLHSTLDSSSSR